MNEYMSVVGALHWISFINVGFGILQSDLEPHESLNSPSDTLSMVSLPTNSILWMKFAQLLYRQVQATKVSGQPSLYGRWVTVWPGDSQ